MGESVMSIPYVSSPPLVPYGIHNENSDFRIHVSIVNRKAYIYPTKKGIEAIRKYNPKEVPVKSKGIVTAKGRILRPDQIEQCLSIDLFPRWDGWVSIEQQEHSLNPSIKGQWAADIVKLAFERLGVQMKIVTNVSEQISGIDMLAPNTKRIQVKCDWKAGPYPGTGNLFLQEWECNPFGYV
jgi:hypothetical protein